MGRMLDFISGFLTGPIESVKANVIDPLKKNATPYPYYHRRFNRVPTIDECEVDDMLCRFEADQQYKRDRLVDGHILRILRQRLRECLLQEEQLPTHVHGPCAELAKKANEADENWFIKYGDLAANSDVLNAYMKQKHRLVFERRQREKEAADLKNEDVDD